MRDFVDNRSSMWIVLATVLFVSTSCAITRQAGNTESSGFLGADADRLEKQDGSHLPLFAYFNPEADWKSITKIWLAPVTLWGSAEESFGSHEENRQRLVQNFYGLLHQEFSKDYEMVSTPGPGTMVIRMAITEAGKSTPVLDPLTSIVPQTRVLMTGGGYVTGKPAFTGSIQIEFRITDAMNGELLAAGIDKRVGNKVFLDSFDSWSDVDNAMAFWAQQARYRACSLREGSNCVEPKSKTSL